MQLYKLFFGDEHPTNKTAPTAEERQLLLSNGFKSFVGNELAIQKMKVMAFTAMGREDHCCSDLNFSVLGSASTGKTTFVRLYANLLGLPFVECSPKSIKSLDALYLEIDRVLNVEGVPLVGVVRRNYFVVPPIVVFFDEAHAMLDGVIQGLLKATEKKDGFLVTESGVTLDCRKVCWVLATTEEGRLFDAFRSRFSQVRLKYLTKKQIAQIVKLSHPELGMDVCDKIAFYNGLITRKTLDFAVLVKMTAAMGVKSMMEVVDEVAMMEGVDKFGMNEVQVLVLKSLANGDVAKGRLVGLVGVKAEELDNFVMPELMATVEDRPALVKISNRGYGLTAEGVKELSKRGVTCNIET